MGLSGWSSGVTYDRDKDSRPTCIMRGHSLTIFSVWVRLGRVPGQDEAFVLTMSIRYACGYIDATNDVEDTSTTVYNRHALATKSSMYATSSCTVESGTALYKLARTPIHQLRPTRLVGLFAADTSTAAYLNGSEQPGRFDTYLPHSCAP